LAERQPPYLFGCGRRPRWDLGALRGSNRLLLSTIYHREPGAASSGGQNLRANKVPTGSSTNSTRQASYFHSCDSCHSWFLSSYLVPGPQPATAQGVHDRPWRGIRRRWEFRVYAGRSSLTRLKAELRTCPDPCHGRTNLANEGRKDGHAPPHKWNHGRQDGRAQKKKENEKREYPPMHGAENTPPQASDPNRQSSIPRLPAATLAPGLCRKKYRTPSVLPPLTLFTPCDSSDSAA
jgi:hypothetical protein